MPSTRFDYPITPIADDKEPHELHPDLENKVHQNRLCVYKAFAGAQKAADKLQGFIDLTKSLRDVFQVPYDDDVWPVFLAYLSDYRYFGKYDSRAETETAISNSAAKGDVFYISIGAKDQNQSGHVIYARQDNGAVEYKDNETEDTTSIRTSFKNHTFSVFKRNVNTGRPPGDVNYRLAKLPTKMIATFAYARTMYKGHLLNSEQYTEVTEDQMTAAYNNSDLPGYVSKLDAKTDWQLYKKASEAWVTAMPAT